MKLERLCPTAAHWSEVQYRRLFESGSRFISVAEDSASGSPEPTSDMLGFIVAHPLGAEWELENIVVAPKARRRGIGTQLLEAFFTAARGSGSDAVLLEVRESNMAARILYEKTGFEQTGRRRLYYSNPPEDAVLYRKPLEMCNGAPNA